MESIKIDDSCYMGAKKRSAGAVRAEDGGWAHIGWKVQTLSSRVCPTVSCRALWQLHDSVVRCHHPDEDHLYQEEMLEKTQKRVVHEVRTAYSCLPGLPKLNAAAAEKQGEPSKHRLWGLTWLPHTPHPSELSSPQL